MTACELAAFHRRSVGCEYFAVHNSIEENRRVQVIVSNPDDFENAHVEVETLVLGQWEPLIPALDLAPHQYHDFLLPLPQVLPGVMPSAIRIRSDRPVAAQQAGQFNAQGAWALRTGLASLYATPTWGSRYYVFGPPGPTSGAFVTAPWIQIVALNEGTTITVKTPVQLNMWEGGPIPAQGQAQFELQPGRVYRALQFTGESPLGVEIASDPDHPIAIWVSIARSHYPLGGTENDNIVEQLIPVEAWGTHYLAVPPMIGGGNLTLSAIWQVVAAEPATLNFNWLGPDPGLPPGPVQLAAGQSLEFTTSYSELQKRAFELLATAPVGLALLTTPQSTGNALVSVPPIAHYTTGSTGARVVSGFFNHAADISSPPGTVLQVNGGFLAPSSSYNPFPDWQVEHYYFPNNNNGSYSFAGDQPYMHIHRIEYSHAAGLTCAAFEIGP